MSTYVIGTYTVKDCDRLFFPNPIKMVSDDEGRVMVVSPATANWLVFNLKEYRIFCKILELNAAIGQLAEYFKLQNSNAVFQKVMGKIFSRRFASTESPPECSFQKNDAAYFYLTTECNLRCPHCYARAGVVRETELSFAEWSSVTYDFLHLGGKHITLTEGEILCYPFWFDIIQKIASYGLGITILSNGTLWSFEQIKAVAPMLAEIQISIDGVDENSNALIRGSNHFGKALWTALKFRETNVRTSIAMSPSFDSLEYFKEHFVEFLSSAY